MNYYLVVSISFSVVIAAVIGMVRLNKINPVYYPFLCLLWLGFGNELISFLLIKSNHSNAISNNVFYLIESLVLALQFKRWGLFKETGLKYYVLCVLLMLCWSAELFIFYSIDRFASFFIILHSFIITLLSVIMSHQLIAKERKNLFKNSIFLICFGLIIFFTYAILVEVFYIYGTDSTKQFKTAIVRILSFINLFTNLLYALAVLWMPRRQKFSF